MHLLADRLQPETNGHSPSSSALSEPDEEEPPSSSTIDHKLSLKSDDNDGEFEPPSDDLTPPPDALITSVEVKADAKAEVKEDEEAEEGEDDGAEAEDEVKLAVKEAASLPEDFIEWEAVSLKSP